MRHKPQDVIKICPTCKKEFGVPPQARRLKQVYCSRSCKNNDPVIKENMIKRQKETFDKKYGGHPMTTEQTKSNFKKSMMEKYGVENALSNTDLMNKVSSTKLEKYGDAKYNNIDKMKETFLKNYGVDNPCKTREVQVKISRSLEKIGYDDILKLSNSRNITPLFSFDDYYGIGWGKIYNFKCNKCETTFTTHSHESNRRLFCEICSPTGKNEMEREIYEFLSTLIDTGEIKTRDRTVLYGKELDFYIQSKNIAIEYNGLYWHSDGIGCNKLYHINKTKSCAFHGIELIHIFEDEWINKKSIVKSMISSKFNSYDIKIDVNCCDIINLDNDTFEDFIKSNCIKDIVKSSIRLGIVYENLLVSVMSFRKQDINLPSEYELTGFCDKLNYNVIGSKLKLFSYFISTHSPTHVISYTDRRYYTGLAHIDINFLMVDVTDPLFSYLSKNYKCRLLQNTIDVDFLKSLEKFNPELSEWENMKLNGYDRIWDCGNIKWVWTPPKT